MASSSFSARTSRLLKLGSVTTTMHVLAFGLGHRNSGSASVHRGPSPECRHLSVILPWGVLARPPSGKTRRPVTQVKKSCSLCCGKCCSSPRIDLRRNVAWINRAKAGSAPVRGGRGLGWGLSAPEQLARRRAGEIRLLRHCRVLVAVGLLDLGLISVGHSISAMSCSALSVAGRPCTSSITSGEGSSRSCVVTSTCVTRHVSRHA